MAAHLLEPVHKAEDQLREGLANLDRQQVKEVYNELIAAAIVTGKSRRVINPISAYLIDL